MKKQFLHLHVTSRPPIRWSSCSCAASCLHWISRFCGFLVSRKSEAWYGQRDGRGTTLNPITLDRVALFTTLHYIERTKVTDRQTKYHKTKHFCWWNVFKDICKMGHWHCSFWSWCDVNGSTFDEDLHEKALLPHPHTGNRCRQLAWLVFHPTLAQVVFPSIHLPNHCIKTSKKNLNFTSLTSNLTIYFFCSH